jgi:hypothetical protein
VLVLYKIDDKIVGYSEISYFELSRGITPICINGVATELIPDKNSIFNPEKIILKSSRNVLKNKAFDLEIVNPKNLNLDKKDFNKSFKKIELWSEREVYNNCTLDNFELHEENELIQPKILIPAGENSYV